MTPSTPARRTLVISSLATLATFLDTTILFVAFPDVSATFADSSPSTLSWVLNAYTIVFAALLIPAGKLADRIGDRRVFLAGSALFTTASMVCGLAPNIELLIVARAVQAAGGAALIPASLALVMNAFSHAELPRAVAIWGVAGAIAGALGPTLGAAIVEATSWRWAFFINLPVGLYTILDGRRHLRETTDHDTKVPSLVGVALVAAAAGLVSYGVVGTEERGWSDPTTIGTIAAGLALTAVFVVHQRRTAAPALDLELFAIRNVALGTLTILVFGTAFSALFFGSILFLTQVWGWSILEAGLGVAPGPAMVGVLTPWLGRLATRVGQRPILIVGGILYAASGLWRLVFLTPTSAYLIDYFPSMVLSGIGVACIFPQLSSAVAQALPPNRRGVGGATLQAGRQFGGTFGVAITIAVLAGAATGDPLAAFDQLWWLIALGGLLTAVIASPMRTAQAA
ncbi:MAG: DHA2 family efflux MFS transporter permease subunit [Acidimicrobiales bacterium]